MRAVIIDSFALIHRVYHALPNLTTPQGEPSGAVYGFCSVLLKVLDKFRPDYILAAFDDGTKPTFRKELSPEYHANRPEKDEEMIVQIEVIKDFLRAMAIPIYAVPGFEGDDVIGSLVSRLSFRKDIEVIVVTGDYDTLQLVNDTTCVFTMRKGISDTVLFNEAAVQEKYGFPARFLSDYKALMGDPSDNYPGVLGIGPKTAQMLIKRFQTIENLYAYLESSGNGTEKDGILTSSLKTKLLAGKDKAFLSKKLAVIRTDIPLAEDSQGILDSVSRVQITPKAREFFEKMGFVSLLKRLAVQPGETMNKPAATKPTRPNKPPLSLF